MFIAIATIGNHTCIINAISFERRRNRLRTDMATLKSVILHALSVLGSGGEDGASSARTLVTKQMVESVVVRSWRMHIG